ncbi:3'-5' exoribonuclease YhaM [soil metagenome]
MARKPPILKLHELQPGQGLADCFALLIEKNRVTTRDGKIFFSVRFKDSRRIVSCAIWGDAPLYEDCEQHWHVGTAYKLRCVYSEHEKYGPKIDLNAIREAKPEDEADGFLLEEYIEKPRTNPIECLAAIRTIVEEQIADEPLKILVLTLLAKNEDTLLQLPATSKQFYPYAGGWLEHVCHVLENCVWLADSYKFRFPDLLFNRDLLLAGAVLHDLGRVPELVLGAPGQPAETSVPGRLLGHIALGRDMIRDAAREIEGLNPELLLLLDHLIQVHLTLPEWGSPRLPMIPEALVLHHADDLDAKMEMYARHLTKDASNGPFTERDPVLGKQLLKSRTV